MAQAQKEEIAGPTRGAPTRVAKPVPAADRVSDLVWAGAHAQAIELATAALAEPGLEVGSQLDLLDLRAESFIAQGDVGRASADADAMLALAECSQDDGIQGAGTQPPGAGALAQE